MTDEPEPPPEPAPFVPSWLRWPPNCCETCIHWSIDSEDRWIGICNNNLLGIDDRTDARYRCPSFQRKDGV